jgi:uncharacterized damage-inducible protein DinB
MTPEQATIITNQFTGMMEQEVATTCKVLNAVGTGNRDYRPDAKSRSAWELATHLATSDVWFIDSIIKGQFQMDPEAAKAFEASFKTADDLVTFYRQTMPAKLSELRAKSGASLAGVIDFFGVMQMPGASLLGLANNHSVHHRGQLAAYLRAMGSKVPSIYGGSADQPM